MLVGIVRGANVRATAKAYSIPHAHLRRAIKEDLLRCYCVGGRTNILLWSEVEDWIRPHPAPTRTRMRSKQTGGEHAIA
jgi:hypothetical protein